MVDEYVASGRSNVFVSFADDIFCGTFYSFIGVEDLKAMINLKELGGTHICLYIRNLYNKLKDSNAPNVYGFINPIHVSLSGFVNNAEKRAQRVRYLTDRLKSAGHNDILFMPYNPSYHWILVVIDMSTLTFYYLNSMDDVVEENLYNFISTVVEKYLAEVKRKRTTSGSKEVEWKVVKVPKQPGSVECGYYVLRFMKEIIENPSILTKKFNGKTIYSQDEVDELFDPIENRYKEEEARAEATRDLLKCATDYKMVVGSLPSSVRDAVIEECNKAEQWLQEKTREQDSLPKDADPILWSSEIKRKLEALDATCKYIMRSKPSPQGRDEANGPDRRRKSDDMQVD